MDAQEYDRIADLLMQIRKKYQKLQTNDPDIGLLCVKMLEEIDFLIANNDLLAQWDAKGWL